MNTNVPFLIQRPAWVKDDTADDHVVYYNNIEVALRELKCAYKIERVQNSKVGNTPKYDGILLSFHTSYTKPNLWNLKKGYIPLYMNFDRFGFSGWSEMAKSEHLFNLSQQTDKDMATDFVNAFIEKYNASNVSKYPQSPDAVSAGDGS